MIQPSTKDAIIALLASDKLASDSEREAVARVLAGCDCKGPDVIPFKEVMFRLGKSRPTVYALIAKGYLKPVRGAGKYNSGITAKSLEDFVANTNTTQRN